MDCVSNTTTPTYDSRVVELQPRPKSDRSGGRDGRSDKGADRNSSSSRRIKYVRLNDIQPNIDNAYIVKGLLDEGVLSVVYGESNVGKTFIVLDMAMHVAQGWIWNDHKVKQGPVVYISTEGNRRIGNRIAAFMSHHEHANKDAPFHLIPCPIDLCSGDADLNEVTDIIREISKAEGVPVALIVIDTLARAMAGGDENTSQGMGAYLKSITTILERTGAHVLSIHHCGKDSAKGARGHSSLRAAIDTEIEVTRDDKIITMNACKQRDLEKDGDLSFKLKVVELGTDQDGEMVRSCVPVRVEGDTTERSRRKHLTPSEKIAMQTLHTAANEAAVRPPPSCPATTGVVTIEIWRRHFYASQGDATMAAKRQAFHRAMQTLQAKEVIKIHDDFVWVVPEARPSQTQRDKDRDIERDTVIEI